MPSLYVGDILYGYCGGCFDDSYNEKIVLHVGRDYVVVREQFTGDALLYNGNPADLTEYLTEEEYD